MHGIDRRRQLPGHNLGMDLVRVTETGAELLTDFPYELEPVGA